MQGSRELPGRTEPGVGTHKTTVCAGPDAPWRQSGLLVDRTVGTGESWGQLRL